MNVVYINNPPLPYGEHTTVIQLHRWSVVNAPRPLCGRVTWEGEFRHGIYYAAGPLEEYAKGWANLDAWPVQAITNMEIVQMVERRAKERGFASLGACLEENGYESIAELARACDLPWRELH
jgi:hypothetical protein